MDFGRELAGWVYGMPMKYLRINAKLPGGIGREISGDFAAQLFGFGAAAF